MARIQRLQPNIVSASVLFSCLSDRLCFVFKVFCVDGKYHVIPFNFLSVNKADQLASCEIINKAYNEKTILFPNELEPLII